MDNAVHSLNLEGLTEKQIKEINEKVEKFQLENQVESILELGGLPKEMKSRYYTLPGRCWFDKPSLELSERVVKSFPRDEEIKPYSDADFTLPYKLTLENNIHDNLLRVRWNHKGVEFELKININEIPSELRSKYFREGTRGVKDTEWHYFGGTSSNRIRQLKLRKHEFLANQKAWYGPMYDLIEGMECEKIMCDLFNMEPENV